MVLDIDLIIYGALPYVSLTLFVAGLAYRWLRNRYAWTAASTQLFETRIEGHASILLHYSILVLLVVHIAGALSPLVPDPTRTLGPLYTIGAVAAIVGLYACIVVVARRLAVRELRVLSTAEDYIIPVLLAAVLALGLYQYFTAGVGGLYPLYSAWLASLLQGQPMIEPLRLVPWWVKLHTLLALVLIAYWPFTKLAGMISYPITYLTRPYQIIRRQA